MNLPTHKQQRIFKNKSENAIERAKQALFKKLELCVAATPGIVSHIDGNYRLWGPVRLSFSTLYVLSQ